MIDSQECQSDSEDAKMAESEANTDLAPASPPKKPKIRNKAVSAVEQDIIKAYLDVSAHVTLDGLAQRFKISRPTVTDILEPFRDKRAQLLDERIARNVKRMADMITADAPHDYIQAMTIYKDTLEALQRERDSALALPDTQDAEEMLVRAKLLRSIESQMFNVLWRIDGQKNINVKTLAPLGVSTAGGGASGDIDRRTTIFNLFIKSVNVATDATLKQHDDDKKAIEADYTVEDDE